MNTTVDRRNRVIIQIAIGVIALFAVLAAVRFIFGGPEDTWICSGEQWIRHGKPIAPMPTTPCVK